MNEELEFTLEKIEDTYNSVERLIRMCIESLQKLDQDFNILKEHMSGQQIIIDIYKEKKNSIYQIIELMKTMSQIILNKKLELEEKTNYLKNHIDE